MSVLFPVVFLLLLAYHAYTDLRSFLLYDRVTLALAAVGIGRAALAGDVLAALAGAAALLIVMLAIYFASRGGMGEGDVKLATALGVWLGVEQGLACLLLAFVGGGAVGLVLACGERRRMIPFGPFLCAAAVAMYFWGGELVAWYWGM